MHYRHILESLGRQPGTLGTIFRKAQNRIQDPAKLRRLVVNLINEETWTAVDADLKGDAYEGLLQKGAEDTKSGAGQYFTPRPLIRAMVACLQPEAGRDDRRPGVRHRRVPARRARVDRRPPHRRDGRRREAVPARRGGARLGDRRRHRPAVRDEPAAARHRHPERRRAWSRSPTRCAAIPGCAVDVVAANPPFGRKSSMTMVNEAGEAEREDLVVVRDDFWASTSNKQLNFLQHIKTMLKIDGRAAVVLPDNVLFEAGAGETIRRRLLAECDLHTILRLPTGIFYAQGVKANVLFFDRKPAAADPWTKATWVYDLRTNMHFTLKTKPLRYERPRRLRRRPTPGRPQQAGRVRAVPPLHLRRADRPRQGQPRHHLAARRVPRRRQQPARPRRARRRDRRGARSRPRPVRRAGRDAPDRRVRC